MATNAKHVEVKFFTKSSRNSVPDTPFSIPATVSTNDLSTLINELLTGIATSVSEQQTRGGEDNRIMLLPWENIETKEVNADDQNSVPDTPFSIPATVSTNDLSTLINELLTGIATSVSEQQTRGGEDNRIMLLPWENIETKEVNADDQHSVPDSPFSIPASVSTNDLSTLINELLTEHSNEKKTIEFDFLIEGQFLRVTLDKHLEQNDISSEGVIELEYIERHPAPKPGDSLNHDDWVSCVKGQHKYILTGCYDNSLRLWSTEGKSLQTVQGHSQPVKCVAWISSEDNNHRFLSGSLDQTIYMWGWDSDKNEVQCQHACRGHAGSIECIAVDDTGEKFCSGGWDNMLKLWSAAPSSEEDKDENEDNPTKKQKSTHKVTSRVPVLTLSGHTGCISAATWTSPHEVCTASWDHTIRLWDMSTATQISSLQGNKSFLARLFEENESLYCHPGVGLATKQGNKSFLSLSYSPVNQLLITGSTDRHIRLWDHRTSDGALVKCTYSSHKGFVSSVAWSTTNEHQFLSGSYDFMVKLWDKRSPKAPLYNLVGHNNKVLAVDWSIPSLLMSGGEDNQLKIFQYEQYETKS